MKKNLFESLGEEAQLQIQLLNYIKARYKNIKAVHVPNDSKMTPTEKYVKVCMGMARGFPDLIIFRQNGGVLLLELKTKKGKLSEVQNNMHEVVKSYGFEVYTSYGLEQAVQIVHAFAETGEGPKGELKEEEEHPF